MTAPQGHPEPPWCCLCGQRHAMRTACDPARVRRLEEWRANCRALDAQCMQIDWSAAKVEIKP
jgi:hypothetical protein